MNKEMPYIAIAPMMDWTDRHCRYFHRLLAPHVQLFTEMVTTGAIIHGDRDRHLRFDEREQPVVLQLGGSNPDDMAKCAKSGADYGYSAININCGCPSDRVQKGKFGACLMEEPDTVAKCVEKMVEAVDIPITVKCRIAIDDHDEFPFVNRFVEEVSKAGCKTFVIHARKAWLQGLSPKQNREVPPLRYDIVDKIKQNYTDLRIIINGGIQTLEDIEQHLSVFDGVMIGREAYKNPWLLTEVSEKFFNQPSIDRVTVAHAMTHYIEEQQKKYGTPPKSITRHMMGLFKGQPGGAYWRRALSEQCSIEEALEYMDSSRAIAA